MIRDSTAVFDVGHHDGVEFIVMEFIAGETLAAALDRGPLDEPEFDYREPGELDPALSDIDSAGYAHLGLLDDGGERRQASSNGTPLIGTSGRLS